MIQVKTALKYAKMLNEFIDDAYNECLAFQTVCGKVDSCDGCHVYKKYKGILIYHAGLTNSLSCIISALKEPNDER